VKKSPSKKEKEKKLTHQIQLVKIWDQVSSDYAKSLWRYLTAISFITLVTAVEVFVAHSVAGNTFAVCFTSKLIGKAG
jgi:hypothetical protein